jgi:hypothetical protein
MRKAYIAIAVLGTFFGASRFLEKIPPHSNPVTAPRTSKFQSSPSPLFVSTQSRQPVYVRPLVTQNGSPFPSQSGYIAKYPQRFTDGYSSVTVDNSKNDSDLFIKLFSLDSQPSIAVSVFFVREKDSFTVKEVRAGKYEVRYQDLDSGAFSRTDSFSLREVKVEKGVEFSKLTLVLHKVSNGNMKTYPISAAEFNK